MNIEELQDGAAYELDIDGRDVLVFAQKIVLGRRRIEWRLHDIFSVDDRAAGIWPPHGLWLHVEPNGKLLNLPCGIVPDIARSVDDLRPLEATA